MDLKEIESEGVKWICLAQDKVRCLWACNKTSDPIKGRSFLDQL